MNVLLVSQCDKHALVETRRILDQFAERRGERTWQTPITEAGLDTMRRLLRKSARKNTAVACHWIRGRDHSELLWIIGDASRFNAEGGVPTNTTENNILRREDENDWHSAEDIRLLAQLAGLLHDLGKASVAFQKRLKSRVIEKNLYRHEWVSLRLFQAFVGGDADEAWLARLANADAFNEHDWIAPGRYLRDGVDDGINAYPFRTLPPLAAAIAWLVVTHHRLPVVPVYTNGIQEWLGHHKDGDVSPWLESPLSMMAHDSNEIRNAVATRQEREPYWHLAGALPVVEPHWRKQAARVANNLLDLHKRRSGEWLGNPYVMHLARLSLMLADHHYSGLPANSAQRVKSDGNTRLYANTDKDGSSKQPLDEHLLGVARDASMIACALPGFERHLPRLGNHRGLRKRSKEARFAWQDKASDAATSLRETAREQGAFIINMASTGCGKTLANARILNALADPQLGLRITYALGLRTLTLQTGHSYRNDLHLGEDELAIRVGGSANRALFNYYEQQAEATGSASIQDLLEEDGHVLYEGNTANHPLLARALHDPDIRNLISAPVLVCTVDHLVPATESLRAGRQIAPMLRLMSSDLILDELDDYDIDDLPALTRLVHWAGMLGTRVVLSSATLPPSLMHGMFMAYHAGRKQYRRNRGNAGGQHDAFIEIPCLWTDEFGIQASPCSGGDSFVEQHRKFVDKRSAKLQKSAALRRGQLIDLDFGKSPSEEKIHGAFAREIRNACEALHEAHAEIDPHSGKRVSFGIVRMANIEPLFHVARELIQLGATQGTRIHLCVYHSRFPLALRSAIEHQLDAAFNRRGDGQGVYRLPEIRAALDAHDETDHLFVVLASPVCEVGRDWDADWAVAEPSSMRALIQLAGRVQRHRGKMGTSPNIKIFDTNLRYWRGRVGSDQKPAAIYVQPGFEKSGQPMEIGRFRLWPKRKLGSVLLPEQFQILSALPRIRPRENGNPKTNLVDLEHARLDDVMMRREGLSAASAWLHPQAALSGVLPQQQPFRHDAGEKTATLVFLPDGDEALRAHRVEESLGRLGKNPYVAENRVVPLLPAQGQGIVRWGDFDLMELLARHAEFLELPLDAAAKKLTTVDVPESEVGGWYYDPWLGLAKKTD